ncbi:MAG: hypothetical protein H7175_14650 [Burkholderiales bacterium]|nr:hypothetical protein [Anaerolineae bacterium]
MNSGRLIGIISLVAGLGIAVLGGVYIAVQVSSGLMLAGGAVVAAVVIFIPVAVLVGFGILMIQRGGQESAQESTMQKQRQLLDIVKSRGQINIDDVALEMRSSRDDIKDMVYQLVGLQVFSGYINWDNGILYSAEASKLRELQRCENCGGEIKLVGKGVVKCRFCGTEYFLP